MSEWRWSKFRTVAQIQWKVSDMLQAKKVEGISCIISDRCSMTSHRTGVL